MSPLPQPGRLAEYARKGVHLGLRQLSLAPEQVRARSLRRQAEVWPSSNSGPRVTIITPRDWAVHVQWEAMIGQALRLRGADVRFITCGGGLEICDRVNAHEGPPVPCRSCSDYVRHSLDAHGFGQHTIRQGWLARADDPGDWPELDAMSLEGLGEAEALGLPLGRLTDVPTKWFLMSGRLGEDPLGPMTKRRFLRSARRAAAGIAAALDEQSPDVVLLLNGLFFFEAIAWRLCEERGIDVVSYERSYVKDTLIFRRSVPACLADVSHVWPQWSDVPLTDIEESELDAYLQDRRFGRRTIDQYWSDARFDTPERPTRGRLVALFTNLTWDSAVIGQEVAFPSIQDWLLAAVRAFADRPDDELIVRIHPAEVRSAGRETREPLGAFLRASFPRLPTNVRVIDASEPASSYPLMEACDAGLVFTSTTGLELALHGKPVIVAGRTNYRGKGFTVDVSSPGEFDRALEDVLRQPTRFAPDLDTARRYAYMFFFRVPVPAIGVEEHVPGLARLTVTDLAELAPGHNRDVDRVCDGILRGGNFMD